MTVADRIRHLLMKMKPGYGRIDTEESDSIVNRSAARHYLRGRGPFQHFTVSDPKKNNRRTTTRGKRVEQRERVK